MSDRMRELVAEGVASGALDPGALDRYDAIVAYHVEMAKRDMERRRPVFHSPCAQTWPLQPCEVGK